MGASGWSYFTDWQVDVEAALNALQREVFEKGEFVCEKGVEEIDDFMLMLNGLTPPTPPPVRTADWKPATVEELMNHTGENGTHSILDISGISAVPEFLMAFPSPEKWLIEAYGTVRPTREIVEQKGFGPGEVLERWHAVYFAVYEGEKPRWWYFEGSSGD